MPPDSPSSYRALLRAALCVPLFLTACEVHPAVVDSNQVTGDALWSVKTAAQATHLAWLALAPVASPSPIIAAMQSAAGEGMPSAACIKRGAEPSNTVRLSFDNCAAPYGVTQLSGDLVVVFTANGNGALHAEFSVENWKAYGFAASFVGSADIIGIADGKSTVKWQSTWGASTTASTVIGSFAGLTMSLDSSTPCRLLDGSVKVTWGARVTESTLTGFGFCAKAATADSCPSGSATHLAVYSGETMSTSFTGATAFTGTDVLGQKYTASFACSP